MDIRAAGYKYNYRFGVDDDIITKHHEVSIDKKVYFFTLNAGFMLRSMDDQYNQIIGSESYSWRMQESDGETCLKSCLKYRLEAYWMPDEEIELLVSEIFDFARRCSMADDAQLVIPVVVDLFVYTVQLEEESMDDANERAIRADRLVPLYIYGRSPQFPKPINSNLRSFLKNMKRIRVEDVAEGMSVMEECSVCLRKPTIGAEISKIPSCGHAFHSHCIVPWLITSNSCPLCRSKAHDFPVCTDLPKRVC